MKCFWGWGDHHHHHHHQQSLEQLLFLVYILGIITELQKLINAEVVYNLIFRIQQQLWSCDVCVRFGNFVVAFLKIFIDLCCMEEDAWHVERFADHVLWRSWWWWWWWWLENTWLMIHGIHFRASSLENRVSRVIRKDCIPDTFVMISLLSTSCVIFCRFLLATFVLCWELQVGPSSLCRTFNRQPWSRNC